MINLRRGKCGTNWFLMTVSLFYLNGCTVVATKIPNLIGDLQGQAREENWNQLRRKNNSAADNLLQASNKRIDASSPVELIHLINLRDPSPKELAPISYFVPQQVGNRLAQLGLRIVQPAPVLNSAKISALETSEIQSKPSELIRPRTVHDPQQRQAGRLYLEGDYVYLQQDLFISLRLIDGGTNEIVATTDYDLPVQGDIYSLLSPENNGDGLFGWGWMR